MHCFLILRIPMEEYKREFWKKEIFDATKHNIISEKAYICSKHFTDDCFSRDTMNRKKLVSNAVPTIFPSPEPEQPSISTRILISKSWEPTDPLSLEIPKPPKINLKNIQELTGEDIEKMTETEAKINLEFLIRKYKLLLNKKKSVHSMYLALRGKYKKAKERCNDGKP